MSVRRYPFVVTTSATTGGGTTTSTYPIVGYVDQVRHNEAVFGGGTADVKVTRAAADGGGTILFATDVTGPWEFQPRGTISNRLGTSMTGTAVAHYPSDGYLSVSVTGSDAAVSGTVHVWYREN